MVLLGPFGQTSPTPDLSPAAYWGVAGFLLVALLGFLWTSLRDQRAEYKRLQEKVYDEFLPAMLASTEALRKSSDALQEVASRPALTPREFEEWRDTMHELGVFLEAEKRRPRGR